MPVLDMTIDDNGELYDGKGGTEVNKGHIKYGPKEKGIEAPIIEIKGDDGKLYSAGMDQNGNIFYLDGHVDTENFIVNLKGERMRIPQRVIDSYENVNGEFWQDIHVNLDTPDYPGIINKLPTGWVNVKVDMEVLKRVRRYSTNLNIRTEEELEETDREIDNNFEIFKNKLKSIQFTSSDDGRGFKGGTPFKMELRTTIQKEMSVVMILRYINEIKNYFHPSSSGFIFESFLAGLIPNSIVNDDNGVSDVTANGKKYQIKLYSNPSSIDILTTGQRKILKEYYVKGVLSEKNRQKFINNTLLPGLSEYYVIGIKHSDRIEIKLFNNNKDQGQELLNILTHKLTVSGPSFNDWDKKYVINILDIEKNIKEISEGLRASVKDMYDEISAFQYNLETILTGVNEDGNIIEDSEFRAANKKARDNIYYLRNKLKELVKNMGRKSKSKPKSN